MTDGFVPARQLSDHAIEIVGTCSYIDVHAEDSDDPVDVLLLLAQLRDARQAVAECYARVEAHAVACRPTEDKVDKKTGEVRQVPVRSLEVPGLGVVEFKRSTKRTEWRHAELRNHVLGLCAANEWDPLSVLDECASLGWRVSPLRAIGVDPGDWCIENTDATSPVLPSRDLDERGTAFRTDAA